MSMGTDIVKNIWGVKNVKGYRHYKNYFEVPQNSKTKLPYDPAILLMDI